MCWKSCLPSKTKYQSFWDELASFGQISLIIDPHIIFQMVTKDQKSMNCTIVKYDEAFYGRDTTLTPALVKIQYNLNGSNPDGSFTLNDSNFFWSLQNPSNSSRKQIFRDFFSCFIMELYVVCTH